MTNSLLYWDIIGILLDICTQGCFTFKYIYSGINMDTSLDIILVHKFVGFTLIETYQLVGYRRDGMGLHMVPSGKLLHNYGKSQFLMGKSVNPLFLWPFSIAF
jgi:hypothetical protein